jgi:hypothetical protein
MAGSILPWIESCNILPPPSHAPPSPQHTTRTGALKGNIIMHQLFTTIGQASSRRLAPSSLSPSTPSPCSTTCTPSPAHTPSSPFAFAGGKCKAAARSLGWRSVYMFVSLLALLGASGGQSRLIEFVCKQLGGSNKCPPIQTCPVGEALFHKPHSKVRIRKCVSRKSRRGRDGDESQGGEEFGTFCFCVPTHSPRPPTPPTPPTHPPRPPLPPPPPSPSVPSYLRFTFISSSVSLLLTPQFTAHLRRVRNTRPESQLEPHGLLLLL